MGQLAQGRAGIAEAVDLHQLPGLHSLWAKRDLNVQGDALCELSLEPISKAKPRHRPLFRYPHPHVASR